MSISRNGRWTAAVALAVSITMVPTMAFAGGGAGGSVHFQTVPAAAGMASAVPGAVSQALYMAKKKKSSGGGGGLTPSQAESKREAIRAAVAEDVKAERWEAAADSTESNAAQLGDPLSFRDAAQHRLAQARKDRDIEAANAAIETAKVALDILHYYDAVASGAVESEWQPIDPSQASSMISEVEGVVDEAEELIAEIEAEEASGGDGGGGGDGAAGKTKKKKRDRGPGKPGTLFIALGSAFTVIGVGGVSLAVAGLVISSSKQKEVEKLMLPQDQDRVDELDAEGSRANKLSYIGAGVAVAGLAVGVPLLVVGVMRRKKGDPGASARVQVTPALSRGFGGVSLQGRF